MANGNRMLALLRCCSPAPGGAGFLCFNRRISRCIIKSLGHWLREGKMKIHNATGLIHTSAPPVFRASWGIFRLTLLVVMAGLLCLEAQAGRTSLSLDGIWQIAEGKMDAPPAVFERTAPVPGLVSLATPAFDAPGPKFDYLLGVASET